MMGDRFLLPAEEEMTEASVFYEAASPDLGVDFLDDVHRGVDILRSSGGRARGRKRLESDASAPLSV
jgi:hypothetical protein